MWFPQAFHALVFNVMTITRVCDVYGWNRVGHFVVSFWYSLDHKCLLSVGFCLPRAVNSLLGILAVAANSKLDGKLVLTNSVLQTSQVCTCTFLLH